MRIVEWMDADERRHLSILPDDAPAERAPDGIPHDPPDLTTLDWGALTDEFQRLLVERGVPEEEATALCARIEAGTASWEGDFIRDLHNELVRRRLVTWADVQAQQTGVGATVRILVEAYTDGATRVAAHKLAKGVFGNAIVALYRARER